MAETTATTSFPACRVATTRSATLLILDASASEVPPYFWTIRAMRLLTQGIAGRLPDGAARRGEHGADRARPPLAAYQVLPIRAESAGQRPGRCVRPATRSLPDCRATDGG